MTDLELAMIHYDGDGSKPYCDLVYQALKEKFEREKMLADTKKAKLYVAQLHWLSSMLYVSGDTASAEALNWAIEFIRKALKDGDNNGA